MAITALQKKHLDNMKRAAKDVELGGIIAGLGGMATQSSSMVNITGGSITGITFGTMGDMAYQSSSAVNISGGFIKGMFFQKITISASSSHYTLQSSDYVVRCNANSGSLAILLPPAIGSGRIYAIKSLYSSGCNVVVYPDTTGTPDLIDGESSQTLLPKTDIMIIDGATNYWDVL